MHDYTNAHTSVTQATNVISIPDNLCVEAETFSYYFLEGYYIHPDFVAKYELGYELGVGGNGLVLQARRRSDGQEVAVKFVYKGDDTEHWFQHPKYGPVTRDVVIMERAKHENIVALLDVFGDEDYLYIVQELRGNIWYPVTKTGKKKFPNGSRCLQGLLSQERVLPLERTKYIFYQLVDAVAHLHSLGISHCDIKPRNILVDSDFKVTLIDFGNCITRPECIPLGHGRVIYGDPDYYRGTRRFYPPEILNELEFDAEAADVWALGLVLCHMLLGRIPFQDTNDVRDGIFMRHFNGWEPLLPMWTVVSSCLETRRTFRATAAELQLRDSFLHTARRRQIYEEPLCIGEWREQK
ncbi:kinase-like domain-containing protein [Irpex rosettiformis]|uniref:Kinase-like domain-containing protein n=1 Tax=Irpex rosettiformis TaxID=378272 RepID=A0ACB8UDX2_9APHY|nr:kinase-like domain-containing protein [Irpex rosettiformis]